MLKAGVWYLVAVAGRGRDVRTYRVGRVVGLQRRSDAVQRPLGFDLAVAWAEASRRFERDIRPLVVVLRLAPGVTRARFAATVGAHAAADAWDAAVEVAGGWRELTLRTESEAVAHDELLRLGGDVEVRAPAALRTRMAATGTALAQRHAG